MPQGTGRPHLPDPAAGKRLAGAFPGPKHLPRGVVPGRASDPTARMGARSAQIETGNGRPVLGPAGYRAHEEKLIQYQVTVEDIALGQAVGTLEIELTAVPVYVWRHRLDWFKVVLFVGFLVASQVRPAGGWRYPGNPVDSIEADTDLSNTQYALLALDAAAAS